MPAYRVRPVPMPEVKRVNPLALIFMSFEQFLSSREERRVDTDAAGREAVPANLRRTLSAFHIGRVQTVGHNPHPDPDPYPYPNPDPNPTPSP